MQIEDWSSTGACSALCRELTQLDLLENTVRIWPPRKASREP